jgi:hypothetical protein
MVDNAAIVTIRIDLSPWVAVVYIIIILKDVLVAKIYNSVHVNMKRKVYYS